MIEALGERSEMKKRYTEDLKKPQSQPPLRTTSGKFLLPNCLLEVGAPKALLSQANVPTPIDTPDADKSLGMDGTHPRMLMPLKGEIAKLLAKNMYILEGMWNCGYKFQL